MAENKLQIPGGVLTGHVFPFVGVKTLSRCACVCKAWRAAADQDVLWKAAAARKWADKLNVPKVAIKSPLDRVGEPATLFAFARYMPACDLKVKDLKQILSLRGVDCSSFLERNEYMRAVLGTQPPSIGPWTGQHVTSKWKAAYIGAAFAAMRCTITRSELTTLGWRLSFKAHVGEAAMEWDACFNPDGSYRGNPPFNQPEGLTWKLVNGSGGNFDAVQVAQYPPLLVKRSKDWGYYLENDYVVAMQNGKRM